MKPAEAERQLLFVEPPPLTETGRSRFQGAIGRDLEAVVHKCLRKSPAERYPSAESLAADLRRLLEGYPVLARPAPLLYRARLFASRHRAAVLAAAAAALGLLMWALSLSLSLREVERQRAEAVSAREASDTIAQILQSAIIEADPARRSIESIGAPEIMAAAAARLEPLERSNPAAFARLALLISRIELEYGRNREAHALALRGLERAEPATLANDLRERLRLIAALSAVRLGDNERAGALLDAIELDATSTDPLVTLARARLLLESTESKHAVELLQTALAAPGADDPKLLTSHELRWQLSDALSYSSNKAAALNVLDETLRWQSTHLPARHAWILDTRIKRLALLDPSTPQAELESEEHQVLAEVLDLYGSDSTLEAFVRGQIGYARYARRDLEGGVEQLSESVRIRRNTKGISDPGYLRAVTNLGIMLLELGQDAAHAEAVEVLIPAETEATRQFGAISPLALYMRTILAKAMVRGGRATEALALLSRSDAAEAHTVPSENNRRAQLEATNEVLSSDACSTPDLSPPIACLRLAERQRTLEAGLRPP
jgi:eukaryotic-like serine/threonine-protein kinase